MANKYGNLEERKEKAIELMKQLDIYKPYIKGFKEENLVCVFENFGGFYTYQEPELEKKLRELEEKYEITIYAVTHELTHFGELYSFLFVNKYKSEWKDLVESNNKNHYVFSYVWNKTYEDDSEFGTIEVYSFGGGIKRIA